MTIKIPIFDSSNLVVSAWPTGGNFAEKARYIFELFEGVCEKDIVLRVFVEEWIAHEFDGRADTVATLQEMKARRKHLFQILETEGLI